MQRKYRNGGGHLGVEDDGKDRDDRRIAKDDPVEWVKRFFKSITPAAAVPASLSNGSFSMSPLRT